jgi:hypothetical protein
VEPVQQALVPLLIRLAHLLILQIRPSRQPSMQLILIPLDLSLHLQVLLPRRHIVLALIAAGQQRKRHGDLLRVARVHHRRMHRRARRKRRVFPARQIRNLAAPAVSQDAPGGDVGGGPALERGQQLRDARERLGRRGGRLEELAQLRALLVVVRRVPADVGGLAVEEVRNEDLVLLRLVAMGEDVGALQSLREEAEDVEDYKDGLLCGRRAGDVCMADTISSEYIGARGE